MALDISLNFVDEQPDLEELSEILTEYYAQILERLMTVGGPGLSIQEQVTSSIDVIDQFLPPKSKRQQIGNVLSVLAKLEPTGETDVGKSLTQLAAMIKESAESDPVLADRLFYNRNANWAGWIDERLDAPGTVFMAVGAGHLAGEKSVQDYLAQRNITVTRVQ